MKTIATLVVALGLSFTISAQENEKQTLEDEAIDPRSLPEIVIKKAGDDFSVYLPEYESKDEKIRALQDAFIAYDLGKDYEGYESYLVTMKIEDGSLVATYNENGKLLRVVEKYDNVKLPMAVIYGVYKEFPGWKIVKDKYLYAQADGDVLKKEYNLKLEKNKETKRIVVNSKGKILKG
ncbi:hypothetical protein [Flavobacterium sp.]|uniref:hypothetical protein n=1 Tax=Flavobacterium sp. TaxID=239 RepID=UPI0028BF11B9|nr:hypothetical protein [Flavobacterium sp.]